MPSPQSGEVLIRNQRDRVSAGLLGEHFGGRGSAPIHCAPQNPSKMARSNAIIGLTTRSSGKRQTSATFDDATAALGDWGTGGLGTTPKPGTLLIGASRGGTEDVFAAKLALEAAFSHLSQPNNGILTRYTRGR